MRELRVAANSSMPAGLHVKWGRLCACVLIACMLITGSFLLGQSVQLFSNNSSVAAAPAALVPHAEVSAPVAAAGRLAPERRPEPNPHLLPGPKPTKVERKAAPINIRRRVVVTEELEEYASLVQEPVDAQWQLLDRAAPKALGAPAAFTKAESEFFLALTLLELNVTTVCQLGVGSARSAITWLESASWVHVYAFEPSGIAWTDDGSMAKSFAGDPAAARASRWQPPPLRPCRVLCEILLTHPAQPADGGAGVSRTGVPGALSLGAAGDGEPARGGDERGGGGADGSVRDRAARASWRGDRHVARPTRRLPPRGLGLALPPA